MEPVLLVQSVVSVSNLIPPCELSMVRDVRRRGTTVGLAVQCSSRACGRSSTSSAVVGHVPHMGPRHAKPLLTLLGLDFKTKISINIYTCYADTHTHTHTRTVQSSYTYNLRHIQTHAFS